MTKFYTVNFAPAAFGIMTLYVMVFEYVSLLGTLSTEKAVSRKIFDYKDEDRDNYLSTMLWFYLLVIMFLILLSLIFSKRISNWIAPDTLELYLVVVTAGAISVLVKFFNLILVNEEKSNEVLVSSISNTLVTHCSAITLILGMKLGMLSRFLGQVIGLLAQLFVLSHSVKNVKVFQPKIFFDFSMLKETLLLASPVMVSTIMVLLFSYVDRLFLKEFIGDVAVGLYGLALIIGKLISFIFEALSTSLFPTAMNALKSDYTKSIGELESLAYKYYVFLMVLLVGVCVLSPTIIDFVATTEYYDTNLVLPLILLGVVVGGSYKIPMTILSFHKIVWFYPGLALFSFIVNAGLNYILIPNYGMVGAGISTLSGYLIYSYLVQCFSFKYMSVRYIGITSFYYVVLLLLSIGFFYESNNFL